MMVFQYDMDKYDIDEVRQMFDTIRDCTHDDIIAIPKECQLYQNVNIDDLLIIRNIIDDAISKLETEKIELKGLKIF